MAAGAVYQGMAESANAKSQANLAEYNAKVQENNARAIEQRTIVASRQQAEAGARAMGTMRAGIAKSGVVMTEGSPLLALAEQEVQNVNENQMIGYQGVVSAQGARSQATMDRTQAKIYTQQSKNVKTASYIGAGSSLLSGFSGGGKKPGGGSYTDTLSQKQKTSAATQLRY